MFVVKLNFDYKEERLQAAIARNLAITSNVGSLKKKFTADGAAKVSKLLLTWNQRADVISTLAEGNDT